MEENICALPEGEVLFFLQPPVSEYIYTEYKRKIRRKRERECVCVVLNPEIHTCLAVIKQAQCVGRRMLPKQDASLLSHGALSTKVTIRRFPKCYLELACF
jgi:hypothetical protein